MNNLTLKEFLVLNEARQSGVKYTEKQVKNVVDRVTATLSGSQAGSMTKIAKRYARLEVSLKALKEKHTELNNQIKGQFVELFDAEDVVLTRVVETSQFTLTMAKEIQKTEGTTEVDYESIVKALSALIDDDLQPAVEKIVAKFTKAIPPKAPIKKLSVSKEIGGGVVESLNEGFLDTLKSWFKSVMSWAVRYDKKLNALKAKAGV